MTTRGADVAISIIAEGLADSERFEGLSRTMGAIEMISAPAGVSTPALLNPLVDEASASWILVVKAGERVSDELASEIARSAVAAPRAWGYRIAIRRLYCGHALPVNSRDPGEVRLFHRRKARLQPDGRMKVQGTVVRLRCAIDLVMHATEDDHIAALTREGATRVGAIERVVKWSLAMARLGSGALSPSARRYSWIEAGWRRPRNG